MPEPAIAFGTDQRVGKRASALGRIPFAQSSSAVRERVGFDLTLLCTTVVTGLWRWCGQRYTLCYTMLRAFSARSLASCNNLSAFWMIVCTVTNIALAIVGRSVAWCRPIRCHLSSSRSGPMGRARLSRCLGQFHAFCAALTDPFACWSVTEPPVTGCVAGACYYTS